MCCKLFKCLSAAVADAYHMLNLHRSSTTTDRHVHPTRSYLARCCFVSFELMQLKLTEGNPSGAIYGPDSCGPATRVKIYVLSLEFPSKFETLVHGTKRS